MTQRGSPKLATEATACAKQKKNTRQPHPLPLLLSRSLSMSAVECRQAAEEVASRAHLPPRQAVPLVGLYNSGSTCYLNSLLQALYMTPQFRTLVFQWREQAPIATASVVPITSAEESAGASTPASAAAPAPAAAVAPSAGALKRSVPFQLQLLFARMALSHSRGAVNTADLTTAFGWSNADNFRQHDVQELMRVLFGALELAWGGRPSDGPSSASSRPASSSPLASLYTGTLLDVVSCCTCGARRERSDPFQDLSLGVSGCGTLRDSLRHFVANERLEGDNALRCNSPQCAGEKQPATKGLALAALPQICTFQLKRFIFDFQLMQRVKVNDAFDFPQRIDMAEFITKPAAGDAAAGASVSASSESTVYDLFAILMHSGVAQGGHYYAYLRSLADGRFYEFNDAHVWELPGGLPGALKNARGGGATNGGSSAYMLMYSRVQPEELLRQQQQQQQQQQKASADEGGAAEVTSSSTASPSAEEEEATVMKKAAEATKAFEAMLSPEVRALIAAEEQKHEAEQAQAEVERRTLDIVVHYSPPSASATAATPTPAVAAPATPTQSQTFQLDLSTELQHFLQQLLTSFGLASGGAGVGGGAGAGAGAGGVAGVLPSNLRLRKYEPSLNWASTVYDHMQNPTTTLENAGLTKRSVLLLEQKTSQQEWAPYVAESVLFAKHMRSQRPSRRGEVVCESSGLLCPCSGVLVFAVPFPFVACS